MIIYKRGCHHHLSQAFQCSGSVFPKALLAAIPCASLTALLKYFIDVGYLPSLSDEGHLSILVDNSCWSGFLFLVGFLCVFRTSQAYARFWDGCSAIHRMRIEWYDSCSSCIAFCKHAKADEVSIAQFQHILIRLYSMVHAIALAELEDGDKDVHDRGGGFKYEMVDPGGLDTESLRSIKVCTSKVELIVLWIQQLMVENIDSGVLRIPPPLLTRAFQQLASGMVAFRDGMKLTQIPFPFPYAQVCEWLLVFHWLCSPLVVSQYVTTPWWGFLFSFLQVFVYWSLNAIALEIENPFGTDANDLDASLLQADMNAHLLLLLEPSAHRTPYLDTEHSRKDIESLTDLWRVLGREKTQNLDRFQLQPSRHKHHHHHHKHRRKQNHSRHLRLNAILKLDRPMKRSSLASVEESDSNGDDDSGGVTVSEAPPVATITAYTVSEEPSGLSRGPSGESSALYRGDTSSSMLSQRRSSALTEPAELIIGDVRQDGDCLTSDKQDKQEVEPPQSQESTPQFNLKLGVQQAGPQSGQIGSLRNEQSPSGSPVSSFSERDSSTNGSRRLGTQSSWHNLSHHGRVLEQEKILEKSRSMIVDFGRQRTRDAEMNRPDRGPLVLLTPPVKPFSDHDRSALDRGYVMDRGPGDME